MTLTSDKARWYEDSEGFWAAFRTADRSTAAKLAQEMDGTPWVIEAMPERKKRGLSANSYYWVLVGKLAAALHISTNAVHNLMLRSYGQPEVMEGKLVRVVIPDTDDAAQQTLESETYHIKPTAETRAGNDGVTYRTYTMLKGSHAYDTKEMTTLINGLVDECQTNGIETKTPDELALMMARYGDG